MTDIKVGDYISVPKGTVVHPYGFVYGYSPTTTTRVTKGRATAIHNHKGQRCVVWGGRFTEIENVTKIDAPAAKEATVTKKVQMVPGSRWRFTKPVSVWGNVSRHDYKLKMGVDYPPHGRDDICRVPQFDIPMGFEFTVEGKHKAMGWDNGTGIGIGDPKNIEGITYHYDRDNREIWNLKVYEYNGLHLPYNQIEDAVEALSIPEAIVYVLRDSATDEYFAGFDTDYSTKTDTVKMVSTFKSAKKYATAANAKSSIMSWTGYFEGKGSRIEQSGGPADIASSYKMGLPESWVLIPVDKVTLREGEPVEGLQEWYIMSRLSR